MLSLRTLYNRALGFLFVCLFFSNLVWIQLRKESQKSFHSYQACLHSKQPVVFLQSRFSGDDSDRSARGTRAAACLLQPRQVHSPSEPRRGPAGSADSPRAPPRTQRRPAARRPGRARSQRGEAGRAAEALGSGITDAPGTWAGHPPGTRHARSHPRRRRRKQGRSRPVADSSPPRCRLRQPPTPAPQAGPAQEAPPPAAQSPPSAPSPGRRGVRGQPPAASVHSHLPACPPQPFPDAWGPSPGRPGLSTCSQAPWAREIATFSDLPAPTPDTPAPAPAPPRASRAPPLTSDWSRQGAGRAPPRRPDPRAAAAA